MTHNQEITIIRKRGVERRLMRRALTELKPWVLAFPQGTKVSHVVIDQAKREDPKDSKSKEPPPRFSVRPPQVSSSHPSPLPIWEIPDISRYFQIFLTPL